MFLQNIFIIFFVIIILLILTLNKNDNFQNKENIENDNLKKNLELVDLFDKKAIKFNKITKPEKKITKYQTFYDISVFPQLHNIDYKIIQNELYDFLNNNNNYWQEWYEKDLWVNTDKKTSWKIIPLMAFGNFSKFYIDKFPKTYSILKNINGLVSAGFSNLGPNTTLKLHKGWGDLSNNVLRCHLGLKVSKSDCKVFVIGSSCDMMIQKEGKWIIFDDSLYHSASNENNEKERIILLIDIKRPLHIYKGESDVEKSPELLDFIKIFNEK
jgi:aspartyl/asparaginyl beta-hydroxylase (cupin superfamily)